MKRSLLAFGFVTLALGACSSSNSNSNDGAAGAIGTAGSGTAGAGTAGDVGAAGATGAAGAGTAGATGAAGAGTAGATGAAGAGTAGATGTAGSTGAAGGACSALTHDGPEAPEVAGTGTFPTPAGGTVANGLYDLTEFRIYPPGSVDPYKRKETLRITGNKIESASLSYDGKEKGGAGTFTTSGSTLTFNVTCPAVASLPLPYTATADSVWLFDTSPGNMEVHVYKKRP